MLTMDPAVMVTVWLLGQTNQPSERWRAWVDILPAQVDAPVTWSDVRFPLHHGPTSFSTSPWAHFITEPRLYTSLRVVQLMLTLVVSFCRRMSNIFTGTPIGWYQT